MKDETKMTIRCNKKELDQWKEAAKDSRMTLSQYVRTVIYRQIGKGKV